MGNVRKRRGKKFHDVGGRTSAEAERVRAPRVADLSTVGSENFTGNSIVAPVSDSHTYNYYMPRFVVFV